MHPAIELIWATVMALIYIIVDSIKALLPASLLPKKDLKGQTVLITGAGSGLGRLMALRFAALGCNLVLWDINSEANEETALQARERGVTVYTYTVDLSNREDIYKVAAQVKEDVKKVDVLVNNAGIVTGRKFLQCPDNMIEKTMDVNINAHFWMIKAFLPVMMKQNKGHVVSIASAAGFLGTTKAFIPEMMKKNSGHLVTIASGAGITGVVGLSDYCASKFAAVGFNESLRQELNSLGKDGVHTTVVCPYYINTGMFDGVTSKYPFILPILDPEYVVDKIMEAVLTNQETLYIPRILYAFNWIRSMVSVRCSDYLSHALGINNTMDMFVGRQKRE